MLCKRSSSIHRPGTPASRAAAKRSSSSGALPRATAAATRISAAVRASSSGAPVSLILRLPRPSSPILSLLQSSIYTQLAYGLAARVHGGSHLERPRPGTEAQLLEHGRHGEGRSDGVSVGHLERDAEPLLSEEGTIHALGADLDDHTGGVRLHHVGAGTTFAGDELGVTQHGVDDPPAPCSRLLAPQFRIRPRHVSQRKPEAHHAAPVHRRLDLSDRDVGPAADLRQAALLHGMLEA